VTSYYLTDGLGSTRALTDGAGAVTDTYSYDVYGAVRAQTGTTNNDYRFTGEQADDNANRGLYYLRARHYDPALGRFLSKDAFTRLNRYAYAGSNPSSRVDPRGYCEWTWSIRDKLDCPKELVVATGEYLTSDWTLAQLSQGTGYAMLAAGCGALIGCAFAGTVVLAAWARKFSILCDQVASGETDIHDASRQYLVSLIPGSELGSVAPPFGAAFVGPKIVERLLPEKTTFPPFRECY
jgi:RHS repeat-associated protein